MLGVLYFIMRYLLIFLTLVSSLDLFGQTFSSTKDLSFLKSIADSSEIIGLGEATHGDGTTFTKKVKIIKYLHDSCGYNLLAFESPLYDGEIARKNVLNVSNPFFKSIFGIWGCEEILELQSYIISTYSTSHPLFFAGFDCQFGGYFSQNGHLGVWFDKLQDTLVKLHPHLYEKDSTKNFKKALEKLIRISGKFNSISVQDTLVLNKELVKILNIINSDTATYFKIWSQTLKCLITDYRINNMKAFDLGIRDSMMYENIEWLREKFKNEKIIVWAATAHISFINPKDNINKFHAKSMGGFIKEKYGSRYYAIAFTAFEGRIGVSKILQYKLKSSSPTSFEGEMKRLFDTVDMFVDMRYSINKEYFDRKISSSRLLYSEESKILPSLIVDGVYYFKEMKMPRHLKGRYRYHFKD